MKQILTVILLFISTLSFAQSKWSVDATAGATIPSYNSQGVNQPGSNVGITINYAPGKSEFWNLFIDERYQVLEHRDKGAPFADSKTIFINTVLGADYYIPFEYVDAGLLLSAGFGGFNHKIIDNNVTSSQKLEFGVVGGAGIKVNTTELIDLTAEAKLLHTLNSDVPSSFLNVELGARFKLK